MSDAIKAGQVDQILLAGDLSYADGWVRRLGALFVWAVLLACSDGVTCARSRVWGAQQ